MLGLLVVSDVQIFREGLSIALARELNFDVMLAAPHLREVLQAARHKQPDVALIDLMMADGLTLIGEIAAEIPEAALIAMGVGSDPQDILQCAEAGATGFVHRDASLEDLVGAIRDARDGALRCAPEVAHMLFCHVGKLKAGGHVNGQSYDCSLLTRRETQILGLIEQGQSNKLIARDLGIKVSTVKNHVHSLLAKMGVRRRGEAAALHRRHLM